MSVLPARTVDLTSGTSLERKRFTDLGLNERALDDLVVQHSAVLGDLLVENEILEEAGRLKYLGRQFKSVDVLFVEVDEDDEPLRLVLVEDKLLKDPGAKRKVIGQLIEYAARFQDEVNTEELIDRFPEHRDWLEQHSELLDRQIERGDFLLIICGDSIHSNVADIVTRLGRRADRHPLSGMELCLVAMDIYERGAERILMPHIVGTVARAERKLEIRVVDASGGHLRAKADTPQVSGARPGGKPNRDQDYFFREVWARKFGEASITAWQGFIDHVTEADIPGLLISKTSAGRPTLKMRSAKLDAVLSVLRARTGAAGIRDVCGTRTWDRSKIAVKARDEFRAALLRVPGATERADHDVVIPIERAQAGAQLVIEALQTLGRALDSA
jgi:hypothetical protein